MLRFLIMPFRKRFGANRHYYRIISDILGIYPNNIELYKLALIHRSASLVLPDGRTMNNERLEFLGDAVLEAIISDYLFLSFSDEDEGFLTKMRSKIVSRATLNDLCIKIGLAEHIVSHSGGFTQKHLYGDALEAIIGALYLDKGYDCASRVMIGRILGRNLDIDTVTDTETDHKSRLIEWCQKSKHTIRFHTEMTEDSSYQKPVFRSVAFIDDMEMGYGIGSSKKEAEQHAAFSVSQVMSDKAGDDILDKLDRAVERNH
jgi:ribonuclease-3